MTILVVDGSPLERRLAGGLLEKELLFRPAYATGAEEAPEVIAAAAPAAVLTDLQMSGMDGLELVRAVRDRHPLLPVILMTGNGSEEIEMVAPPDRGGEATYPNRREPATWFRPSNRSSS